MRNNTNKDKIPVAVLSLAGNYCQISMIVMKTK